MGMLEREKTKVGDKILVTEHMYGRLYTPYPSEHVGQTGLVVETSWQSRTNKVKVRMLDQQCWILLDHEDDWDVIESDCPLEWKESEQELQTKRFDEFVCKVLNHDYSHSGYSNTATAFAVMYLLQDPRFVLNFAPSNVRKNGTINPSKIQAYFQRYLRMDSWTQECPINVPAEFKGWRIPGLQAKTSVKWGEVAAAFAVEETA